MKTSELRRGTLVISTRDLTEVCKTPAGTLGVVFEETNAYGDGNGPMVRWLNNCACNVYDGDVGLAEKVLTYGGRDVL